MPLTLAEVDHIAQLARLELTEEEKERYRQQLSAILDYAASLQTLDTREIPPTSSVLPSQVRLRPDIPVDGLDETGVLGNSPQTTHQQFRVPPILDVPE